MDGVEIQAQTVENILLGTRLKRGPFAPWTESCALLLLGLVLIFALSRFRPLLGVAIFFAGAALLFLLSYSSFRWLHALYDPTFPIAANSIVVLSLLACGFADAERRRRESEAALQAARDENLKMVGELRAASKIQKGMLPDPRAIERLPRTLDFFALLEPAQDVGGDLYDAFMLDEKRLCFMIGDVSGKGVPASLFMALAKTLAKSMARREQVPLDRLLRLVNEEISRENPAEMFVSAIVGILEADSGVVELCNAGHNAPILLPPAAAPRELDGADGPPLCVDEEYPYTTQEFRLRSGDILLLMTDGVTEAENHNQDRYGKARAIECFAGESPADATTACKKLHADVKKFTAGAPPSDDLAILAIRFIQNSKE
jgi:serine phosphatase RsbU (regulator of sigma subunit)